MFHPGQRVVFIGWDIEDGFGRPCPFVKGHVYTVREVFSGHYFNDDGDLIEMESLRIVGIDTEYGYASYGFRPITEKKTDISIFDRLKLLSTKKIMEPV